KIENKKDLAENAEAIYTQFKGFFTLPLANKASKEKHTDYMKSDSDFYKLLKTLYDYNYYSGKVKSWGKLLNHKFNNDFKDLDPKFKDPTDSDNNNIYKDEDTAKNAAPYFKA